MPNYDRIQKSLYNKTYREKHSERLKQQNRDWAAQHREELRVYAAEYRKTHPDLRPTNSPKRRVQKRVFKAIKSGKLARPDACSRCGVACVPDAHHHLGYDHPFDVQWLCRSCHRLLHWKG